MQITMVVTDNNEITIGREMINGTESFVVGDVAIVVVVVVVVTTSIVAVVIGGV